MGTKVQDADRLAAVRRSGLIDTDSEALFDELTKAAAQLLDAPFAFLTVVDDQRSFWKSTVGIDDGTRFNSVGDSFCQYVIESDDDLIVNDAEANPTTRDNPSISSMGVKSWAGCPVRLDGHVLGTFCVVDQQPRDWTDQDRGVLQNLAVLASREIALRTELSEVVTSTASARVTIEEYEDLLSILRTSFLPPTLPEIPGLTLAAWHQPAPGGDLLLGDFYDAFPLDERRFGIVVGDVCGHGAEAAKLTALVRYSLRAAAIHHQDPAHVLAELDRLVRADGLDTGRFATLVFLTTESQDDGSVQVSLGRAGHPYPILLEQGKPSRTITGAGGPPVGILADATPDHWQGASFRLAPGQSVVLYTDGAIECRVGAEGSAQLGEAGLLAAIDDVTATDADAIVSGLVEQLARRSVVFGDDTVALAVTAQPDSRAS